MHGSSLIAADLVVFNAVVSQVLPDLAVATVIMFAHTCNNGADVVMAIASQQLQDIIDAVLMSSMDVLAHECFTSSPFRIRDGSLSFSLIFKERTACFCVAAVAGLRADID